MEEPPVEAASLDLAVRSRIAVRQNRLWAVGARRDLPKPRGNLIESHLPRDALKLPRAFRADAPLGIQHPVGVIDPVLVPRHLVTEKPAGVRMLAITPHGHRAIPLDDYLHRAGIRAIVRTDRPPMNDLLVCGRSA